MAPSLSQGDSDSELPVGAGGGGSAGLVCFRYRVGSYLWTNTSMFIL